MKQILLILSLAFFVGLPGNVYSQEKPKVVQPKQTIKVKNQKPPKNTVQVGTQPKVIQQDPPVRVLNTKPVKLVKIPTLNAGLYKNITPLKKIDVSDSKDRSDKSTIQTTGGGGSNGVNVTETKPVKDANNCLVSTKTLDITTTDFSYFTESSTPDFIKPGVVINYSSILDGRNTINTTPRNPLTIYLINTSAGAGNNNLSVDVENPQNVSGINNALGQLTGQLNTQSIPANMSFEISEISSEKEFQYGVTGSYSYGSMLSAKFGVTGGDFSKNYYYLIKFTQNMYNVAVDPNTVSFANDISGADKLAYVSEVTYGRKGLMMIKTKKSMSEIKAEMKISANSGIHKGDISGFVSSVNKDDSREIRVFFYGGSSNVAARSLQENDMKNGFDNWVAAEAGNGLLALPISYRVKNLKGEQLQLKSVFTQPNRNCVPKKALKLKVTLLEIDPKVTTDSDKKGDYGIRQHVKYTANKTVKEASGNVVYNTFKKETNPCKLAGDKDWSGAIPLACGSSKDQIHVNVNGDKNRKRLNNIRNSVVFDISTEEASDKNAKFEVQTWVKEYSDKDILMNHDFSIPQEIPIYFVLNELQGLSSGVSFSENYSKDGALTLKVHNFNDDYPAMFRGTDAAKGNQPYLDAVLRARNSGSSVDEKAFLYLRFELID